tara:strand:- start:203 stop:607 length:405 start_codon:yes stop_codon:yes gene_type:complete
MTRIALAYPIMNKQNSPTSHNRQHIGKIWPFKVTNCDNWAQANLLPLDKCQPPEAYDCEEKGSGAILSVGSLYWFSGYRNAGIILKQYATSVTDPCNHQPGNSLCATPGKGIGENKNRLACPVSVCRYDRFPAS